LNDFINIHNILKCFYEDFVQGCAGHMNVVVNSTSAGSFGVFCCWFWVILVHFVAGFSQIPLQIDGPSTGLFLFVK